MMGSTSCALGAFATASLTASTWMRGYAAYVDLNPDCITGRLCVGELKLVSVGDVVFIPKVVQQNQTVYTHG